MNENSMRALLDQVADDVLPPVRVDVPMITRRGRRSLWWRRVYLPGLAPIAAAAAVALVAALGAAAGGGGGRHHPGRPGGPARHALMPVPRQFGPLQPFVSFGWLPAGFTPDGLAQPAGSNVTLAAAAPSADGRTLALTLNAAGACRLTGKETFKRPQRGQDSTRWVTLSYPHSLNCGGGLGLPIRAEVAPVGGGPAYQGPDGDLIWEFGTDAWAQLMPSFSPYMTHEDASRAVRTWLSFPPIPQLRPRRAGAPVWHQSAASWNALRTVAERLRYAARDIAAPLYGFRIAVLPTGWRVSAPAGLQRLGGKIASSSWSAGPADDPGALSVSVWPAAGSSPLTCNYIDGQSSYVTLDGAQAVLRTIDQAGKHWQSLCGPDIDGMQILIALDLNIPGTSDKPLPGGSKAGNALTVFGHLTLLGPNVARWTTRPLG
jgi:hypothetical protein